MGEPFLASQTPIFLPFDREYFENGKCVTCQLELNISSTRAF